MKDPKVLLIFVVVSLFAGAIGSLVTIQSIPTWYSTLLKPCFTPPDWLFGPVWTLLYILMGLAAYTVWEEGKDRKQVRIALTLFGAQLGLNTLWSLIFFGLKNVFLAFVEILVLVGAIGVTVCHFKKVSKKAANWMLPYLAWVIFAAVLNFFTWRLNP